MALAQHPAASPSSCLATLPETALQRVPVYLEASATDTISRSVLPGVDLLIQLTAARVRTALGATSSEVPRADDHLRWHQLDGVLSLVVHRDGRFVWTLSPRRDRTDPHFQPSMKLVEDALLALRDGGERIFVPEELVFDSVTVELNYQWPSVSRTGAVGKVLARAAFPVFTLRVPWLEPVQVVHQPRVRYPEGPRMGNAQGNVLLQFIVDTTGRAQMSTVRELGKPRLGPELHEYYRAFVAAAKDALHNARFSPAQLGGCNVKQLVQLPFAFRLRY
jgi:TonB family protein